MKRVHLFLSGRVQGVGYRFFAERLGKQLDLTGWVRNLPDDRVELVAEGPEEVLHQLVERCRKGPGAAQVTDLQAEWSDATGELKGFRTTR